MGNGYGVANGEEIFDYVQKTSRCDDRMDGLSWKKSCLMEFFRCHLISEMIFCVCLVVVKNVFVAETLFVALTLFEVALFGVEGVNLGQARERTLSVEAVGKSFELANFFFVLVVTVFVVETERNLAVVVAGNVFAVAERNLFVVVARKVFAAGRVRNLVAVPQTIFVAENEKNFVGVVVESSLVVRAKSLLVDGRIGNSLVVARERTLFVALAKEHSSVARVWNLFVVVVETSWAETKERSLYVAVEKFFATVKTLYGVVVESFSALKIVFAVTAENLFELVRNLFVVGNLLALVEIPFFEATSLADGERNEVFWVRILGNAIVVRIHPTTKLQDDISQMTDLHRGDFEKGDKIDPYKSETTKQV